MNKGDINYVFSVHFQKKKRVSGNATKSRHYLYEINESLSN